MEDRIFSEDELPCYLSVKDVSRYLGLGLTKTYDLVNEKGCPKKKVGERILIPRDKFLAWFELRD